jgi:hypothetical protein
MTSIELAGFRSDGNDNEPTGVDSEDVYLLPACS